MDLAGTDVHDAPRLQHDRGEVNLMEPRSAGADQAHVEEHSARALQNVIAVTSPQLAQLGDFHRKPRDRRGEPPVPRWNPSIDGFGHMSMTHKRLSRFDMDVTPVKVEPSRRRRRAR
jgi:hypothetical protein